MSELKVGGVTVSFEAQGKDENNGSSSMQVTIDSDNGVEFRIKSKFKSITFEQDDVRHMLNTIQRFLSSPKRDLDHVESGAGHGAEDPG